MQSFHVHTNGVDTKSYDIEMENFKVYEGLYNGDGGTVKYVVKGNIIYDKLGLTKIARIDGKYIFKEGKDYKDSYYYERDYNTIYYVTPDGRKPEFSLQAYQGRVVVCPFAKASGFKYTLDPEKSFKKNTSSALNNMRDADKEEKNQTGYGQGNGGTRDFSNFEFFLMSIIALPLCFGLLCLIYLIASNNIFGKISESVYEFAVNLRLIFINFLWNFRRLFKTQSNFCNIAKIIYGFIVSYVLINIHRKKDKVPTGGDGYAYFILPLVILLDFSLFGYEINMRIRTLIWSITNSRSLVSILCYLLPVFNTFIFSGIYDLGARNLDFNISEDTIDSSLAIICWSCWLISAFSWLANNLVTLEEGFRRVLSFFLWLIINGIFDLILILKTD